MKTFLIFIFALFFFAPAAFGGELCADGSEDCVKVEYPEVTYYETRDGVTEKVVYEEDIPLVVEMRVREPVKHQIYVVWVDYDANSFTVAWLDVYADAGCLSAFNAIFADVRAMMGENWDAAEPIYALPIDCTTFETLLGGALKPVAAR